MQKNIKLGIIIGVIVIGLGLSSTLFYERNIDEAEGIAKIIQIDGQQHLRFENFQVTNGPDLRVYLTQGGDIKKVFILIS